MILTTLIIIYLTWTVQVSINYTAYSFWDMKIEKVELKNASLQQMNAYCLHYDTTAAEETC